MRQKRAKSYRKQMGVYLHAFKFREPYQTLLDDQIILQCHRTAFDLEKGLNRTVQSEVKPMITQCCMQALYMSRDEGAIEMAKKFERRRCNHNYKDPKSPSECIEDVVVVDGKNKHRYVVATLNEDLRSALRGIPGVPLIYINRSVMIMEPLSKASKEVQIAVESGKLTGGLNDAKLAGLRQKDDGLDAEGAPKTKKRSGPKGPNPLSVKKKKKEAKPSTEKENSSQAGNTEEAQPKKRRRKHKKSGEKAEDNSLEYSEEKSQENKEANHVGAGAETSLQSAEDVEPHSQDD
ncbi:BA75_03862T0 [Komagataella pastoris]|uniref:U three protein 23 n=1 Tax=Komagataella pastoris TaxID=4922 RepID=A0A1B2JE74_PICPA|nr:BA75_03862T0 [Komagataella pastoris]